LDKLSSYITLDDKAGKLKIDLKNMKESSLGKKTVDITLIGSNGLEKTYTLKMDLKKVKPIIEVDSIKYLP
jgi:hypothetical protein